jgi:hypothetical protein
MDSGYTPYFDPDYFEIKNGHYVRVKNNMYETDSIGLPKVTAITPLNSFNMDIYKRYYQPTIDASKHWRQIPADPAEKLLRKYIIERTRIVLVGQSCMIVKAWSGEHLLIHKSKYQDFINDQRKNTQWLSLDTQRFKELGMQEKYIEGLSYFANKLKDPSIVISAAIPPTEPIYTHYDRLLQEMAALSSSMSNIAPNIQEVFQSMILGSNVPQSWHAVNAKYLSLKMAKLAEHLPSNTIQAEILDKLDADSSVDQTNVVLDAITKMIPLAAFIASATLDDRLAKAKTILDTFASGPPGDVLNALEPILTVSAKDQFPIELKVLPKYALKSLSVPIASYRTGYNHLHGIRSIMTTPQMQHPFQAFGPLSVALRSAPDDRPIQDIATNANKFVTVELAKANVATKELQNMGENLAKARHHLSQLATTMKVGPHIHALRAKHDAAKTDIDRAAIDVADQKQNLERRLQVNTEIASEIEQLRPQMAGLQTVIIRQQDDLKQWEDKARRTEQALTEANFELIRANEKKLANDQEIEQMKANIRAMEANAMTMAAKTRTMAAKDLLNRNLYDGALAKARDDIDQAQAEAQAKAKELEAKLNAERNQVQAKSDELEDKARELKQATAVIAEKTTQLAQMAAELKTFEERNAEITKGHQLLMRAIREEGDSNLKQLSFAKDQEISAIKQEAHTIKRSLDEAEGRRQILEANLKTTQDNAKALEREMNAAKLLTRHIRDRKHNQETKVREAKDRAYQQLLADKLEADKHAAELAAYNQSIQSKLTEMADREQQLAAMNAEHEQQLAAMAAREQQIAMDQSTTESEKDRRLNQLQADMDRATAEMTRTMTELSAQKEGLVSSSKATKAALEAQTRKTAKVNEKLAELESEYQRKLKEVTESLEAQAAQAAQRELDLAAAIQQEKNQAAEITRTNAALAAAQQGDTDKIRLLERDLQLANEERSKAIADKIAAYNDNKKLFREVCKNVINTLNEYQNVIKIPLMFTHKPELGQVVTHQLTDKQITIELDLDLINALNRIINKYLANEDVTSRLVAKQAGLMYHKNSANGTFLDEIPGKVLEFVYSMHQAISNHKGINSALTGIQRCGRVKEQYDILEGCKQFIAQGKVLFEDEPARLLSLVKTLQIQALTAIISRNKSRQNAVNDLFSELDAYTFDNTPDKVATLTADSSQEELDQLAPAYADDTTPDRAADWVTPSNTSVDSTNIIPVRPLPLPPTNSTRSSNNSGKVKVTRLNGTTSVANSEPGYLKSLAKSSTEWLLGDDSSK